MRLKNIIIINILFLFIFNISLFAQSERTKSVTNNDAFYPGLESDEDMKPLKAEHEPFAISYGGWINSAIIDDRSGNDLGTYELLSSISIGKIWLKTSLPYNSYIYLRARDVFLYYIDKPEGSMFDDTENDFDLDAGFFSIANENRTMRTSLGRKFFMLGSGLVFNGRGDGGEFNFFSKYIDAMIFGAYTGLLSKDTNPYRLSSRDFSDEGKRIFFGGTISKTIYNQTLYLLGLYQTDKNDDIDDASYPDAKSTYNSQYYGLGLKGVYKNGFYFGEFIIEQGTSYTDYIDSTNEKKDINASAAVLGLNYYFNIKFRPVLLLNYAYGSGDSDKNYTSSLNGNIAGEDKGFMYFGTYAGGYALRPYLSNIHVYRAGVTFSPLYDINNILFKRINVIAVYTNYQKDRSNSPINAGEAGKPEKDIGHGFDLSLRWKIFSDFSVFGNFGLFVPGSAYESDEKNRTLIMSGIYLSF